MCETLVQMAHFDNRCVSKPHMVRRLLPKRESQERRLVERCVCLGAQRRLVMGTRCGDLDPAVVLYLMQKCQLSAHDADVLLNKQSGLLGLAGKADVRAVLEEAAAGSERAALALDVSLCDEGWAPCMLVESLELMLAISRMPFVAVPLQV